MNKKKLIFLCFLILGEINFISPSNADIIIEPKATVHQIETDIPVVSNSEELKNIPNDSSKIIIDKESNIGSITLTNKLEIETDIPILPNSEELKNIPNDSSKIIIDKESSVGSITLTNKSQEQNIVLSKPSFWKRLYYFIFGNFIENSNNK